MEEEAEVEEVFLAGVVVELEDWTPPGPQGPQLVEAVEAAGVLLDG